MTPKIFVLGDSRTGTTSLHKFFMDCGFSSIHYFVDEVNRIAAAKGSDKATFAQFKTFVEQSDRNAFSDYPVRLHFKELRQAFPDARFILSTRKDVKTWAASMRRYFADRKEILDRLGFLSELHVVVNDEIRTLYADAAHFIEICIDDDGEENDRKLREFLGISKPVSLKKLNATTA